MWAALASAAGNLVSGFLNKDEGDKNRQAQQQMAAQNMAAQKEFAQHGIRWKVDDAVAAGLHPLAALGASTSSFSPVSIGDTGTSSFGQDIGRAISSMKTLDEKSEEVTNAATKLALEKGSLENDLLRSQIRRLNAPGTAKGTPSLAGRSLIDGQPSTHIATASGFPIKAKDVEQQPDTAPATARIRPGGVPLHTDKRFSDAEDIETRYGDVIQELGGAVNLGADVYNTYVRPYRSSNPFAAYQRWKFDRRWKGGGK